MENIANKQSKDEAKYQGVPKRANLYARLSKYAPKTIKRIVELLDSKNESVALGAAKALLDKCLPDVKAVELTNETQEPLKIVIVADNGFIPPNVKEDIASGRIESKSKYVFGQKQI